MWQVGRTPESGFTLLEVLVVLTLLSLVGSAAALWLPDVQDRITFAKANTWLDSTLTRLRLQARREGRMTWLDFDPDTHRYRTKKDEWVNLPSGVTWGIEPGCHSNVACRIVTFLPDGTGSGGALIIQVGIYSSIHSIDWLTGSIRHAPR